MKRILTGLQPSGELTLGNYIGGIKGTIERQDKYESFIFVLKSVIDFFLLSNVSFHLSYVNSFSIEDTKYPLSLIIFKRVFLIL